ncbi:MAG: hypothetical protein HKN47_16350, partial [Pirellulaceae bacterium]|nr:hypothetical protein [Pirellulaceae bacterium]
MIFRVLIPFCILAIAHATMPVHRAHAEVGFEPVAEIFAVHCVRCHNEANPKGDFSLAKSESFFASGMVDPGDQSSALLDIIAGPDRSMPKDSPPLSDQQVAVIA